MAVATGTALQPLNDTDLTIADRAADVRGRELVDATGGKLGKIDDLLTDDTEATVPMLRVEHGGILGTGADHFLVPVDAVTNVTDDEVRIDRERSRLTDVPGYDPALARKDTYYGDVHDWWGYAPYWGPAYVYPAFPYDPS